MKPPLRVTITCTAEEARAAASMIFRHLRQADYPQTTAARDADAVANKLIDAIRLTEELMADLDKKTT